ncbi:hypothetical protein [Enterovibrio nigricans]|uniref:Uncharacterized protein n=1 Tax=Enterovibrio nigricans DSM 22720 TaxID=1121868 RepID=A0A1T4V7Z7_9GAMM|nr:hypothetical protein [Enterovibrio nigricans]SKA61069.1 hypothetical protein SAMN02745132_03417 [Enterovibrio nigricans DSM 22720]
MKLKIFRWIIVVVLVIGAFVLGIEYERFTNLNACLDMGEKTAQGSHRICLTQ